MDNNNPLLQPEVDPRQEEFRNKMQLVEKEKVELERLCYEVFHINPDGMKLFEILKERFVVPALFSVADPNATNFAIYWEGFKEGIRGPWSLGLNHKNRIAGVNG